MNVPNLTDVSKRMCEYFFDIHVIVPVVFELLRVLAADKISKMFRQGLQETHVSDTTEYLRQGANSKMPHPRHTRGKLIVTDYTDIHHSADDCSTLFRKEQAGLLHRQRQPNF